MTNNELKIFTYHKNGLTAIVLAFNRGHAVKQLAKKLEEQGVTLEKDDKIEPLDMDVGKKGHVLLLGGFSK